MWIKDPKTKEPSTTLTFFTIGFVVAIVKLTVSNIVIKYGELFSMTFPEFTGIAFGAVIGSLGAIYGYRKFTDRKKDTRVDGQ